VSGPIPVKISNSEIQTFKQCRRRWWLAYYRKLRLKTNRVTGPLALGSRIHIALEAYYTDGEDPVEVHRKLLEQDRLLLVMDDRDVTELNDEGELGRVMLEGYIEWLAETGADSQLEVIAAEERIAIPLLNGEVELQGKLDMRVRRRTDGVRLFCDHKTAQNFSDITRTAHMDEQMLTYHLLEALKPDESERCDGGIYNMLRKVKRNASARPPFYDRLEVRHNNLELRSFWQRVHGSIMQIMAMRKQLDAGGDHAFVAFPTPSRDCHWRCEFFAICPMFDDGSAVEQAVEDLYTEGDPYERYRPVQSRGTVAT